MSAASSELPRSAALPPHPHLAGDEMIRSQHQPLSAPRKLARPQAPSRPRGLRDILDRSQFEAVLRHERSRADRDENEFSLVLIKIRAAAEDGRSQRRVARAVLRRLRDTDEVGWYGEACLCVLLPNTDYRGARTFENGIRRLAETESIQVVTHVYTYPSQWVIDGKSAHPGPRLHRDSETQPQTRLVAPHRGATSRDLMPYVLSGFVDALQTESLGLEAVESLLARPLPWWKRAIDIIAAGSALLVLAPLMAAIVMLIKCGSPGPVMFGQWRAGLGGKPFWIYKFRTMIPDAEMHQASLRARSEQDGPAFKMKHDPRITPIGRVLRVTSLDELPQLWNVFKGDMSLVGPRPLPLDESAACKQWQKRRLDLTPGLTCIWQVKGRNRVTFVEWMRMDLAYARTRSLLHDVRIILQTIPAVLLRRGAR